MSLFQALGGSSLYVSRAFGPLFVLALSQRALGAGNRLAGSGRVPAWFTCDAALTVLAVLALAELAATRNREIRELLREVDVYYKPVAAVVGFFGSGSGHLRTQTHAASSLLAVGLHVDATAVLAVLVFGSTLTLALLRKWLADALDDHVGDHDFGLRRAGAWFDQLWTLVGPVLFVLFPLLVLVLMAIASVVYIALRRHLRAREERAMLACACGQSNYRAALCCTRCGVDNDTPMSLGLFGQGTDKHASDRVAQGFLLFAHRRCPRCATRLRGRSPAQVCGACRHAVQADPAFLSNYERWVGRRLPRVLVVTSLLGSVPLLGTVAGMAYYRLTLVGPYRSYVPRTHTFVLRWGLRLAWLVVLSVQFIPGVGLVALPLMAYVSYRSHRVAFTRAVGTPATARLAPAVRPAL